MFLLTEWAKLTTSEKGQLMQLATIAALSDYRAFPLLKYLPFANRGGTSYVANRTGASAANETRVIGTQFTTNAEVTVNPYTFAMRVGGGNIEIDGQQLKQGMVGGAPEGAVKAGIVTRRLIDMGARFNRMFHNGDQAAGSGLEWTGVNKFCADEGRYMVAGADGAALTSDMLDNAIGMVPGANVIKCNLTLANKINNFGQGITKTVNLADGAPLAKYFAMNYKGIDIVPTLQAPANANAAMADILPFTEVQGDSGAACSRVTILRCGMDGVYGIQNSPLEMLAEQQNASFIIQVMEWFMAAFCTDMTDAVYQIKGVKNL